MKYRAWIINNETGEGRWYEDSFDWDSGYDYLWTDGNYSCDCNRALFWSRAGGEPDLEIECGESLFSVPFIEWESGLRVLIDSA